MRDRLIELIKQADKRCADTKQCETCVGCGHGEDCISYNIADYLLAEGVIVPPVKVGRTVYRIRGNYGGERIHKGFVCQVNFYNNMETRFWDDGHPLSFTDDDIGKTVFLTREEAEKALAERRDDEIH